MNQYKKLASNTMIFAIGTFSSKILVFLMTRFYTSCLTTGEFGIADLIAQTANVIIPIASVGMSHAVIRFGLDQNENKHEVFSIGVFTVLIGFLVIIPFAPLLSLVQGVGPYTLLVYLYVLMSSLQGCCGQFVRARGHVRLFAIDGIFRTATAIGFNILFLAVFGWGITGYVLATICSDALSVIGLTLIDKLHRFLHISAFRKDTAVSMLRYSIPMIPATICAWVISMSDRYFLNFMMHDNGASNGLYAFANKLPTILILISSIFIEAWQISTINNNTKQEQERFFSTIGNVYQSLVFMVASAIILFAKPAAYLLAGQPEYYIAWQYIPLLIFGSAFACLSNFQNSIYTLFKKTMYSFLTVLCGACLNLLLNYLLIPPYGINGASVATLTSYIVMFLIRAIHSRKYLVVHWKARRFAMTFFLLCCQSACMLLNLSNWIPVQIFFFVVIFMFNSKNLLIAFRKILKRR